MTSYFIGSQVGGGVNVWWWFPREHVAIGFSLFRVFFISLENSVGRWCDGSYYRVHDVC